MRLASLVLLAALCLPTAAKAQGEELLYDPRENTNGVMLGLAGHFVPAIRVSDTDAFEGASVRTTWATGGGVQVGYGYGRRWLFYAGMDVANPQSNDVTVDGDFTFWHYDFGARLHHHLTDHRIVPYLSLAVGAKQLHTRHFIDSTGVERSATLNARSIAPGVGVLYFPYEDLAFDASLVFGFGSFTRLHVTGVTSRKLDSEGGTSTRLRFGLNWYPSR